MSNLSDQANEVYIKISSEWGAFRRWLARRPLTGFWCAVAGGLAVGWVARWAAKGLGLI